jgi:hypothetical protein
MLIANSIKARGKRFVFIATEAESTEKVLQSVELKHIGGIGYGYLLSSKAFRLSAAAYETNLLINNGVLYVAQAETKTATSTPHYIALAILSAFSGLRSTSLSEISAGI